MILTITLNAALDRIIFLDEFQPGRVMRAPSMVDKVGGKGLAASVALRTLGAETVALSFVAGSIGQRLVDLLDDYNIRHDLIWLAGETRLAHVLAEQKTQRHSHLIVGALPVPPSAWSELLARYQAHLAQTEWVIAAGSLPPGLADDSYGRLIALAHAAKVPSLLDLTGRPVRAILPQPPTILKMNWVEFCHTFEVRAATLVELHQQAQQVYDQFQLTNLVITCGEHGILALTKDGSYLAVGPSQVVANAAGAGDAASAALAWRLAQNDSFREALRWAAAVGAAVVLTAGTADCEPAEVERLLPRITIQEF